MHKLIPETRSSELSETAFQSSKWSSILGNEEKNIILENALQLIGANFSISHSLTRILLDRKNSNAAYNELYSKIVQHSTKVSAVFSKLCETVSNNNGL